MGKHGSTYVYIMLRKVNIISYLSRTKSYIIVIRTGNDGTGGERRVTLTAAYHSFHRKESESQCMDRNVNYFHSHPDNGHELREKTPRLVALVSKFPKKKRDKEIKKATR